MTMARPVAPPRKGSIFAQQYDMEQIPAVLPVLPIRNVVLFPTVSMPLVVGRPRSLKALEFALDSKGLLVIVTQRVITSGDPSADDLYKIGTLCKTEEVTITEAGGKQIVVTGLARYRVLDFSIDKDKGALLVRGEIVSDTHSPDSLRSQALLNHLKNLAKDILELLPGVTEPLMRIIEKVEDAAYLTNVCASYLNLTIPQKQELLETIEVEKRMEILLHHMQKEKEVLNLQREIREKMSERLTKSQREAILREQLRTIRSELGEEASEETADLLEEKIKKAALSEEALKQASEELKRLRILPSVAPEYHVVRTYLEWLVAMPWNKFTKDNLDIHQARKILDEDHYGLENVKRRILQFLAVAKLKNDLRGPILCLVGPPGVGKTSLGQSIARTLGRKFIRTSLGGVRDEAEIRGHRRTYVGAMPGRIIHSIKRAESRNPLMMLDEIDKLSADFHGDPAAAMLEVLDPEQNKNFTDHYLDVPFDLSDVFFITTANIVDTIPPPLRDRMEIIEVHGYTTTEKLQIAKNYLLPRELKAHGFRTNVINLPDETLIQLANLYTREAGVRELQRKIAALLRAIAEKLIKENIQTPFLIQSNSLPELLGPQKYFPEMALRSIKPGVITGLAWTPHGGDILFLEATHMQGKGNLILTGQLGEIMKESAQIALSLARSNGLALFNKSFDFSSKDIHIHVPAGSIPKDGPSAGSAILLAIVSLLRDKPVDPKLGLTGEITLRGAVLPVGGIKEKVLAAHRAGLTKVILPKTNSQDLVDVPEDVRNQLKFLFVDTVDEMIDFVFKTEKEDWISQVGNQIANLLPNTKEFSYYISESMSALLIDHLPARLSKPLVEMLPGISKTYLNHLLIIGDPHIGLNHFIECAQNCFQLKSDQTAAEIPEKFPEKITQIFFKALSENIPQSLFKSILESFQPDFKNKVEAFLSGATPELKAA